MALSANQSYTFRHDGAQRFKTAASTTIYKGSAVGVRDSDKLARVWAGTAGDKFVGIAARKVVTDASGNFTPDGVPAGYSSTVTAYVEVYAEDAIVENVTVTGHSLQTDVLEPVWMTDDNTFTLTPQADDPPVGVLLASRSLTDATGDVAIFDYTRLAGEAGVEGGYREDVLGVSDGKSITTTYSTAAITSKPLHGAGRITKLYVVVGSKMSGFTGAVKFKLKVNSTFLKNTAGTFIFSIANATIKTQGAVSAINIAHSTTYSAKFGPGDLVSVYCQCATAGANTGTMTLSLLSARRVLG